ncbi:MAG: insulinase family protein [Erysipelotrichaceae bacterium]|nr:insulinase family protein [Erysipelotrichaceae bacterium]
MHTINTSKFIDSTISLRRMMPLKRESVTALNLMALMIKARSEKYPSRDKLQEAMSLAYGLISSFAISGYGGKVLLDYRFRLIRPELIEDERYIPQVLDLMDQVIHHPVLTEEGLQEAKYILENKLIRIEAEPDSQALLKALAISQPEGSTMTIAMQGYREDLQNITLQDILKVYEEFKTLPFEILEVGDLDPRILDFLESLDQTSWKYDDSVLAAAQPVRNESIEMNVPSCSLVQVYRTGIGPRDPQAFALLAANSILGTSPMSLLFEEVREKHSLCYQISSSLIRFDGALIVSTGTQQKNLEEVRRLIAEQIERLKKGDFDDSLLRSAKMDLQDSILSQQDHPSSLLAQAFLNSFLKRPMTSQEMIDAIGVLTRQDIMEAAAGIELLSSACITGKEVIE